MKWIVSGLSGILLVAVPLTAAPINYTENWDAYALGSADPAYVANWNAFASRYEVDNTLNRQNTAPNSLKIGKDVTFGISHDLTSDALAVGQYVVGLDSVGDSLEVGIIADLNTEASADFRGYSSIFVEVSLAGDHAPDSPSGSANALAFGMTHGINGFSVSPYFFDGQNWQQATGVSTAKRWNIFTMTITANQVVVSGDRNAGGSQTFPRAYLGGFDTISVRTVDDPTGANPHKAEWADEAWIIGGSIVPEPATAALVGLGGLMLLRRRRI